MEVGTHSPWVSRLLVKLGHEVIVASAGRVREMIGEADKSDALDAEMLARFGRAAPQLLRAIQHRSEEAQRDLAVIRARDALVRSRSLLVHHVRGVIKSVGGRVGKCSVPAFPRRAREVLPEMLVPAMEPVLRTLEQLTEQIRAYDRSIDHLCKEGYPETELMRQVKGVGPLVSLAFRLVLENPRRFRRSRSVGAFLGLRTRRRASGERDPELRITKKGDKLLRRLLVQSAQYILGPFAPDSDLRRWGLRLAGSSKKGKKRAVVAVARKLAVLLHHLWRTGEVYEPLRQSVLPRRTRAA
jgi:transposase